MAGKAIKLEQTGNRQVNDLQQASSASTQSLRDGPFNDGLLLTVTFNAPGPQEVNHGLGRAPTNVFIMGINVAIGGFVGTPTVLNVTNGPNDPTKSIYLLSFGGPQTVFVWVS
jgi:hypothetical protein